MTSNALYRATSALAGGLVPLLMALSPSAADAQSRPAADPVPSAALPTPDTSVPSADDQSRDIVVTGTAIRRVDYGTPSPIQLITSQDLARSGYDTVASVLSNVTANGAGTLSSNNSEAFAGGASGVALRGLSVGATLVLVDGHRLAPYPLSDDGERQFVDVNSIPFNAVERIEILKDGASAIYGSDAIAGVVNVILKKQITGVESQFEVGDSQHGGDATRHIAIAAGTGDLAKNGFNAFITAEYRAQSPIFLSDRGDEPWGNLNYTNIGGNDLRPGAPNALNSNQPATRTPYLVNPDGTFSFLGTGCNTSALAAGNCTYTSPQKLLSPTRNINVLGGFTKELGNDWEAKLKLSFFDSKGQQSNAAYNIYPGASFGGNVSNPIGGIPVPGVGSVADFSLPANYQGSGSQAGGYLEGVIPGIGLPTIDIDSKTYRAALDVTGNVKGWDVTGSLGFSEVVTNLKFHNYVNYSALYAGLTNGSFDAVLGGSPATNASIAPDFSSRATDKLYYAEVDATRKVFDLPGGDLSVALGAEAIKKSLNNAGPASVLNGTVGGTFSTYAIGSQTDVAEYLELDAKVFHSLEINGAVRDDWYDTYGNSVTPKVGVKWQPLTQISLRGTFSKGFRAPTPAEFGRSATVFGLGGFADPILCGNAVGQVPADCSEGIGFVQTTTPKLKPEISTSFTGGTILTPVKHWNISVDYYHIKIEHQIVSESELPSYTFDSTTCERGPNLPIAGVVTGTDAGGNPILGTATPLAGPLAACLAGYVNAQSTVTSGLDVQSEYTVHLGSNVLTAKGEFTHIFTYDLTTPDGTTYHLAGTHGPSGVSGDTGNPRDRVNASFTWEHGPFSATASGYWISSYSVTDPSVSGGAQATCAGAWNGAEALALITPSAINQQYCRVKSFTSINLITSAKLNDKVTLTATVDNLFDAKAPFDAETYGGSFTPFNPSLHEDGVIGRFFMLTANFKY